MPHSIFFYGGYAIHGTTDIAHLGQVASHGCVRLHPDNATLLFDLVDKVGMKNTKISLIRS
jgi:lipoprotein-anchoring transpeptidase ErfK/SrfK